MCLLAIQYKLVPDAPVLVAANREEFFERPSLQPSIQSGKPRVLCGLDQQANGTWLGVNQHGLFVAICNRRRQVPMYPTRSRGVLCKELLRCDSALAARDKAMEEMSTGKYDGANFVAVDAESGWCVHAADDINASEMSPGLNIISNAGDLNNPQCERSELARRLLTLQTLDSPVKFLAIASKVFARPPSPPGRPSIVMRGSDHGTVSSTLIALGKRPRDAIYQYSSAAPDKSRYEDYSPLLRDILSRGIREARAKAEAS